MENYNLKSKSYLFFTILFLISYFLSPPRVYADITTGLVGYWNFDEGSGTTAGDSSGSGNSGTLINGPTWVSGKIVQALSFDGVNDIVSIGSNSLYNFTSSDFSFAFWVKPTTTGSDRPIFTRTNGWQVDGYNMYFTNGTGNFAMETYQSGAGQRIAPSTALTLGVWSHVAFVRNGSVGRFYINGVETSYSTQDAIINPTSSSASLGFMNNPPNPTIGSAGSMDDVRIYNRALTLSDVTELYNYTGGGGGDVTPPSVSISSPTSGSTVSGSATTITATATDDVGVVGVQFKLDGANLGVEDTASPYTINWDTTGVTNGSHLLSAVARDATLNTTTASTVTVIVSNTQTDTQAPTIPTNLLSSNILSNQVTLSWNSSTDNVAVAGYKIFRGGIQVGISNTTSFTDNGLTQNTTYSYTVSAYDTATTPNNSSQSNAFSVTTAIVQTSGVTEFYVDNGRTSSGNGSSANPWKNRSDVNWTAISTALQGGSVTIYFSSRATWGDNQDVNIPASTNSTTNRLTLDGQSQYNTVTSGTAVWQTETILTNKATMTNAGGTGGSINVNSPNAFITVCGFKLVSPTWGGVNLGIVNPTINLHDILVENNIIDTPVNNHGVWFGYGEAGSYNITTRNNTIMNTPLESIYMGHYSYMSDTITGTIVEYNTVINAGTSGQGDIDIKAGNFGAIVRYNTFYGTGTGRAMAGVVVSASDVQVYGNTIYSLTGGTNDGVGIEVNADGDGQGNGRTLANILIYNNLIYGAENHGIGVWATTNNASIIGMKVLNNTIVGNGSRGFQTSASGGRTIGISAFANNILVNNMSPQISISSGTTFFGANYNNYYGTGTLFNYQGTNRTWAQWQTLGFDANGLNIDPQLDSTYKPTSGSPTINTGTTRIEFAVDKTNTSRPQGSAWDIGAYEFIGSGTPTPLPGDINLDHTVNSLDWSLMNSVWFTSNTASDLNHDGQVNSLDFALLSSNWLRTW